MSAAVSPDHDGLRPFQVSPTGTVRYALLLGSVCLQYLFEGRFLEARRHDGIVVRNRHEHWLRNAEVDVVIRETAARGAKGRELVWPHRPQREHEHAPVRKSPSEDLLGIAVIGGKNLGQQRVEEFDISIPLDRVDLPPWSQTATPSDRQTIAIDNHCLGPSLLKTEAPHTPLGRTTMAVKHKDHRRLCACRFRRGKGVGNSIYAINSYVECVGVLCQNDEEELREHAALVYWLR